jgi:hypothetical protein
MVRHEVALCSCCDIVLVRAIEALGTIEPTGPFERALARLLMAAYKRRLWAIAETALAWVSKYILSASEYIGGNRTVVWISENCRALRMAEEDLMAADDCE